MSKTLSPVAYKIVIVGSTGVGKSAIIQRLIQGTFSAKTTSTCGADFYTYLCPVNNDTVKLQIWDTAGQERFKSISKTYFRNAVGAVLVYDLTNLNSFDELTDWLYDLQSQAATNAYVLLVGNKVDLEEQRQVSGDAIRKFAQQHRLETLETSALSGKNVKEAFARLSLEVSTRVASGIITVWPPSTRTSEAVQFDEKTQKRPCC
jgi:small GTP-binding protein